MKENTKQILKVSICTLMALVLFAGVILMCIYFSFDTSNDGVAKAYTDEEVGVTNLEFTVDEGFFIKNFNYFNGDDVLHLINYYCYFIPDIWDYNADFYDSIAIGDLDLTVSFNDSREATYRTEFYLEIEKYSNSNYFKINVFIERADVLYFSCLTYDYVNGVVDEFITDLRHDENIYYPNYYVNITSLPQTQSTFANQIVTFFLDSVDDVYAVEDLSFSFNYLANLGCIFSPNQVFASPPVVIPSDLYNSNLQDNFDSGYDEGYQVGFDEQQSIIDDLQNQIDNRDALIEELREEIRYYESLDLNYQEIQVFNPARMKPSTFVYNGVTYTSDSMVKTDDGWDVYYYSYHNQELPPNYGVGFSLFLEETISNTKFHILPDIVGWYNYTYCSEPDEQGTQQCYQVTEQNLTVSVGYRTQNGNIVKVGEFTNSPGMTNGDFFISQPTNELVFFYENCNLIEIGNNISVLYYQYDTQSIYNAGFEYGKRYGILVGREEGYYQGVADANDYSFFSLFTSVFDAPITAIVGKWGDSDGDGVYQREGGMLNFYIPGLDINFAPFLLSLFTIAIIILVIRFVMARKS